MSSNCLLSTVGAGAIPAAAGVGADDVSEISDSQRNESISTACWLTELCEASGCSATTGSGRIDGSGAAAVSKTTVSASSSGFGCCSIDDTGVGAGVDTGAGLAIISVSDFKACAAIVSTIRAVVL